MTLISTSQTKPPLTNKQNLKIMHFLNYFFSHLALYPICNSRFRCQINWIGMSEDFAQKGPLKNPKHCFPCLKSVPLSKVRNLVPS